MQENPNVTSDSAFFPQISSIQPYHKLELQRVKGKKTSKMETSRKHVFNLALNSTTKPQNVDKLHKHVQTYSIKFSPFKEDG